MELNKVSRFCELVRLINEKNEMLASERVSFYDGGIPFNTIYALDLNELQDMENEILTILNK